MKTRADRDLAGEFLHGTGFTPQSFSELVFCTATKFLIDVEKQNTPDGLILTREYFRQTNISNDTAEIFLERNTVALKDIQTKARTTDSHDSDFLLFHDRPLMAFGPNRYLCIDPGFLLERAGRSFYWSLHAASRPSDRLHLLGYWAVVVEKYAQWLVETTYPGRGTAYDNPRFSNGDEACDIMIEEGTALILIEVKASVLTAAAKYSFTPPVLLDELLRKAIEGEEGDLKGFAQLRRTIERFQNGEPIDGLCSRDIRTIYPVIVFLDRSFTSPALNNLYSDRFNRATLDRRPKITAPYSSHKHDLSDIIDDYYKNNRTRDGRLTFGSLSQADLPLLRGTPPQKDKVQERFDRFNEDLLSNTFDREDQ